MKTLSIQQPWAWLICNRHKEGGIKDIENRTWPTKYRGPCLIHAGKKIDRDALKHFWEDDASALEFETGGIVGIAIIIDCVTVSESEWFTGPYGFVLLDAKPLPFHPCRGKLGFFEVEYPHKCTPLGTTLNDSAVASC